MSKLSTKTLDIAHKLLEKHGKDVIYVKVKNGQMYFNETSARYGLSKAEFQKQFEVVKATEKKAATPPANEKESDATSTQNKGGKTPPASEKKEGSEGPDEELAGLRAKYKEVIGKNAFNGWDAETLQSKISEAEAAKEEETQTPNP